MKQTFLLLLLVPMLAAAQTRIITVGGNSCNIKGFTNRSIQQAVDALPPEGGTVKMDTGTFSMMAPVKLRSNVNLTGSGPSTVLKRIDGFSSRFTIDADYGELKVTVENATGFKPGMSIQINDKVYAECWDVSVAVITAVVGDTLYFDTRLIRDYEADREGKVTNAGSCVLVADAEKVTVSGFTIDGNKEKNDLLDGCNGGGIAIIKSKKVTVENVHVQNFNGEGITWQITEDVTIRNNEISNCTNMGLHPGSGSPGSVIENNNSHHNKVGLFICWRVNNSNVKNNRFHHNVQNGISTGHKDTDVLFEGNHIYENGGDGVYFREEIASNSPHRNTFIRNTIENNGGYGIVFTGNATGHVVKDNIIRDTKTGTQKAAVFMAKNIPPVEMKNNSISGHPATDGSPTPVSTMAGKTPYELMNVIVAHQLDEIKLKDGDYAKGAWEKVKASKMPVAMYWSYPTGVILLGMQRVYAITGDKRILNFVTENNRISAEQYAWLRWQKKQFGAVHNTDGFEKLWRLDMLDDCGAMGAAILESGLRHNARFTPALKELVDITGNFVTNVQYRLKEGTFWRPNSPDGPTIWADDLYMSLPFLVRWSEYKKDKKALDDAAQQIIDYAKYLQDKNGVWFHAYFVDKKTASCCKWGRANGWVAVAIAEVLSVLPPTHPRYEAVLSIYKKHINGLLAFQAESGLWNQVIDHPELSWGTETSCSSQFAYAIARGINKGWLNASYIPKLKKALEGLSQRINANGSISRVCMSTSIGNDLEYYNNRSSNDEDYHGVGLMLLALTEIHTLLQNEKTNADHSTAKQEILCDLKTDKQTYWPAPATTKPAYLQTITDPVFGTKLTRITGNPGESIPNIPGQLWPVREARHGYSKRQAWNADQTMIFLDRHSPYIWLDGNTYQPLFIRTFDKGNPDRPRRDLRWSHTEPHIMYYLSSLNGKYSLGKWDVVQDVLTELIDLSDYKYCSFGDGEGNFSADGTRAAVYAVRHDGTKVIFVADAAKKTKGPDIEVTTLDNCTISPLGNYIVIDGDFAGGSDRIQVRRAADGKVLWTESRYGVPSHWDVQVDQNGDEVVAGVGKTDPFNGKVIKRRLSDGKITVLVDKGYASHTSGRNIHRPGWVYVTYNLRDEAGYDPYRNEIVAVRLDGKRTERIAGIHSNAFTYIAEAHGSPSPDGLRVIFASDWDSGTVPVQAYVVDFRDKVIKKK